jgi:hypothetical protein
MTTIPLVNEGPRFGVRDRSLVITTDDLFVERFVRESYSRAILGPADSSAGSVDHGSILTNGTGSLLVFNGEEQPWPVPVPDGQHSALTAFYGSRELFRRSAAQLGSCWPVYGAAVEIDDRAVVIVGPSGSGKTTLSLALTERGAHLFGDECVFIDTRSASVSGLARSLMIREPALPLLSFLPGLAGACARSSFDIQPGGRIWYAVDPNAVFDRNVIAAPARLGAVIVLEDGISSEPQLTRLPNSMTPLFITRGSHIKAASLDRIVAGADVLADVACYRLWLGAPAKTAELIAAALASAVS